MKYFDRRTLIKFGLTATAGIFFNITAKTWAKIYLTPELAKNIIWGDISMSPFPVTMTKSQMKEIKKQSKVRVRSDKINAWKVDGGGWFILDQVIGKHENIDIAVGIDATGGITGIEILEYRETYGYEVANPKWRKQFTGKNASVRLRLGKEVQNISGATLSCRHITDGINRLTQTWEQVLKNL
ncbi:MAG: FMN-binding protein [Emcibacteraceae bacterium]|nr:FMN-binding protein [Emcibacteraceae bacterium]